MAGPILADRIKETTTTTGTGTLTLLGAATGFRSFSVFADADTCYYVVVGTTGEWEVGLGTVGAAGTTLARTTVLSSSNAGSAVDFAAGTKQVFCDQPANAAVVRGNYLNTDASNYQRWSIVPSATAVTFAAETAGTGADDVNLAFTAAGSGTIRCTAAYTLVAPSAYGAAPDSVFGASLPSNTAAIRIGFSGTSANYYDGEHTFRTSGGSADILTFTSAGLTITDGKNVVVSGTTGTKIGTATTQKLAFYNATPIVQGASVADATDAGSAITQLNALISRIEATGLIATV